MKNKMILKTEHLTKEFKKEAAVKDLSMEVRQHSIYGLLGPNGAGKSTTLKMITGLIRPTSGNILFDSQTWERRHLSDIGFLIEQPAIYGNLTARENLKIQAIMLGQKASRIDEVLEITGLQNTGHKRVSAFSLGMKQRLGIAGAIINRPRLLILDEPTNGLDPLGIQELRQMIRSFPDMGMTVILSSHMLSEVEQIADDIGIISYGKLGYQGVLDHSEDLESLFTQIVMNTREKAGVMG